MLRPHPTFATRLLVTRAAAPAADAAGAAPLDCGVRIRRAVAHAADAAAVVPPGVGV